MDILLIVSGLALLFFGGEALLKGSVAIALKLRVSTLLVGLVLVGFGTSLPELTVSVAAAIQNEPEIAIGNVIGSNIANILFILGLCCFFVPISCTRPEIKRDCFAVIASSLVAVALACYGEITRLAGFVMVMMLVGYVVYSYIKERKLQKPQDQYREEIEDSVAKPTVSVKISAVLCGGGLLLLIAGAYCLLEGAVNLAQAIGVPDAIIGLTLVAVGTSLPELATGILAAYRKHTDLVLGNILGSNIFNILGILGITSLAVPIPFTGRIAETDVWVMLAVSALLLVAVITGRKLSRFEGGMFFLTYLGYILWAYNLGRIIN